MNTYLTGSPRETIDLARRFAAQLVPGDVVTLAGPLGSGKTQFVRGVCEGLNVRAHVASPTFTLINEYDAPLGKVVHVDLYRITRKAELAELGIDEYLNSRCLCLIEWPEIIVDLLPPVRYEIVFEHTGKEHERRITIGGVGRA